LSQFQRGTAGTVTEHITWSRRNFRAFIFLWHQKQSRLKGIY